MDIIISTSNEIAIFMIYMEIYIFPQILYFSAKS